MKKRRKNKNSNFGFSLLLVFILIILMSYASFLLYSFAKNNGLINIDNPEKSTNSQVKKDNNNKLQFLSNLFLNKNNEKDIKTNNNDNKTNNDKNDSIIKNDESSNTSNNLTKSNNNTNTIPQTNIDLTKEKSTGDSTSKNEENDKANIDSKYKINSRDFTIYLAVLDKQYELYLARKTEKIDYTDSPVFAVISFLINLKPKDPYLNLIPIGTKLLGAWIKQGILYLDFNKEFLNNKNGLKSIEIQIYQIVNTAMQFKEINGVRFLIEGKTKKYYSDEGFLFDITFKFKQFSPSE